tara:strand:+ start:200 stop:904 length:705 start_codon:yes stop_codon:yes gene_type:complete
MYKGKKILAVIPARGGSKGIPKKNIKKLNDKPLIAFTIEQSLNCPIIDKTIVSTDSDEIAEISKSYGAEVPFIRPSEISQDSTPDLPVFEHVLNFFSSNDFFNPDLLINLRPTSPIRKNNIIERAVNKMVAKGYDSVRSVSPVKNHPYWMVKIDNGRVKPFLRDKSPINYPQRQLLPELFYFNGNVDVVSSKNLTEGILFGDNMGIISIDSSDCVDIDSQADFKLAEYMINKNG